MTLEQFNKASFSKDTIVIYKGQEWNIDQVDFTDNTIYVYGIGWLSENQFEIKPHIELFGEATDLNPANQ